MKITWHRDLGTLYAAGEKFHVDCDVRNELNGRRKLHDKKEVVHAVVNGRWGPPYMPRKFPKGIWSITGINDTTAPEFAPIKITTNARQELSVWALDASGGYDHETPVRVIDSGYHLHWSANSKTTLGCGRVGTDTDAEVRNLAFILRMALKNGESILLEVL